MDEIERLTNEKEADGERSSEDIRQDIAQGKENIAQTVDQIGEQLKEKLDWREYVKDSPYLAIGAAAGAGYLASRVFSTRTAPLERIMGSMAGQVRESFGDLIVGAAGTDLLKVTLLGFATKAAAGWIKDVILTAGTHDDATSRPQTERDSSIDPIINT